MAFSLLAIEKDSYSSSLSSDGKPVYNYFRQYKFDSDSATFVPIQTARNGFIALTGISLGEDYVDNNFAKCNRLDIEIVPSRPPEQTWLAMCGWSTDVNLLDDDDPANRRWKRKVSTYARQRNIFRDRDGVLILDAAGSPFDGGVAVEEDLPVITFQHNVAWAMYDLSDFNALSNAVNSSSFMGCDAGTLRAKVEADEQWEGNYHFVVETITIQYEPLGWQPRPANAGLWYKDGSGKRQRIKEGDGRTLVSEPEPLYADGSKIPIANRPADCNFIEADHYSEVDMNAIGLPLT
jgi:hypothetical protein